MHAKEFSTWTSLVFLAPLALAVNFRIWYSVAILLAVIITSAVYHRSQETRLHGLDVLSAWLLILSNLWNCYRGNFSMPYFGIVLILVVAALYVYFHDQAEGHSLRHGLWHILSSLITIFSLLVLIIG